MSIIPPWVRTLLIVLLLGAIFWVGRVYERRIWQRDAAQQETQQVKQDAARELAGFVTAMKAATDGTRALENYVERTEQDRPVVERVVTHVRNLCVRQPAAGHLPMPEGAGLPQEASGEAADSGDRAFADAIADDLPTCAEELVRLDEAARYLRKQDGEE